jgi:large subunit ribosomal protein L9
MLIILQENVENLGIVGDLVKVSDGYARNFLLPRHLALIADQKNIASLEHHKRLLEKKRLAQKESRKELAQKLNQFVLTLSKKSAEGDKIYGSVSALQIAESLEAQGFIIPKKAVQLQHPLKTLGAHTVTLKLDTDITCTIEVHILKQ